MCVRARAEVKKRTRIGKKRNRERDNEESGAKKGRSLLRGKSFFSLVFQMIRGINWLLSDTRGRETVIAA